MLPDRPRLADAAALDSRCWARPGSGAPQAAAVRARSVAAREDVTVVGFFAWSLSMQGWLKVEPAYVRTTRQLAKSLELGTTYARSLPRSDWYHPNIRHKPMRG